ncbi:MAG: hypothetical protein AABY07_01955 [Nanoarchaeota archaeon]
MRIFYMFLLLLIVAGCAITSNNEPNLAEEIIDENFETITTDSIVQEQAPEEETKSDVGIEVTSRNKINKRSMEITISSIRREDINGVSNIFFTFSGEDLIKDELQSKELGNFILRNPLEWNGYLYISTNEIKRLFLCDSEDRENKWSNTFCEDESFFNNLKSNIFYLIYTTEDVDQLGPKNLGIIESLGNTYIFKLRLQKV